MTPDEIRSELADCKVVNRYLSDVNGDRFWVFGMASDTLLLRRIVDGVMRPLCTRTFDEVASIEPADKVQDSETIEAQQQQQEEAARGMILRRAVESSDVARS